MASNLSHLHLSPQGFLFDHHSGLSFSTNSTGAHILEQLIQGGERQEILNAMILHFEVTPDQAASDLDEFLANLRQNRVLPREARNQEA